MDSSRISPVTSHATGFQRDSAEREGPSSKTGSSPHGIRPEGELPRGHAEGRKMSGAFQRRLSGEADRSQSQDQVPHNGLQKLPAEVLKFVVDDLHPKDHIALAFADPMVVLPRIHSELRAALFVIKRAPKVLSLERFKALLQVVQEFPASFQGKLLAPLGARVGYLPSEDQQQAIDAFLEHAKDHHEVLAAFIVRTAAPKANTADDFNHLLSLIQNLPTSLQGSPLAALHARILDRPSEVRQAASNAFFASAENYSEPEVRAAFIATTYAPRVERRTDFDALLTMTRNLPEDYRGAPLAALGARIHYLPFGMQQNVINVFLPMAQGLSEPRPALLDELIQAAANGLQGLADRERTAFNGPAKVAVRDGENVQAIVHRYGITTLAFISALQMISMEGPAGEAVKKGDSVSNTAEKYGITNPALIAELERISIEGPAGEAVKKGDSVSDTAEKYGITTPVKIAELESLSIAGPAGKAVKEGASASDTAEKYGITSRHRIVDLEMLSIKGPAREAIREGASVADTAKKYGITMPECIAILEWLYANSRTEGP